MTWKGTALPAWGSAMTWASSRCSRACRCLTGEPLLLVVFRWSERGEEIGQGALERGEQGRLAAVGQADPDQRSGGIRPGGEVEEVFVLAHNNAVFRRGMLPDQGISGFVQLNRRAWYGQAASQ